MKSKPKLIWISTSRLKKKKKKRKKKNKQQTTNTSLLKYVYKHTPTESRKGDLLIP